MGLQQLAITAAQRSPEAPAVEGPDACLSYGRLEQQAARLAGRLAAAGVGKGDRVALWLPKSARAIVAMQASLRLGAIYVPIDPEGPALRARKVILDAGARCLISDGRPNPLTADDPPIIHIGDDADGEAEATPAAIDGEDLAYILYTSGSTGTPKGVAISHRAALAFVGWAAQTLAATAGDRFACHAPLHFDLSVLDVYAAFMVGARVCLIPEGRGPAEHVAFIREHAITIWYSVPSALMLMIEHGQLLALPPRQQPRALLFAGEPFPIKALRQLRAGLPAARLLNLYGPTETNVCTAYEVDDIEPGRSLPVPIGNPCCGDEAWAVTDDGRVAGPGESGELLVRGPTTMTGYWGQPPLGDQPYATGDLVRVLADGSFEFVGRRDHLVKVRGMRIEIGEIEAALLELPSLAAVAVVVAGEGLDARLLAFARLAAGATPLPLLRLKRHCAERLPRYMVVDKLVYLDELPMTGTGKIDRRALQTLANTDTSANTHASQ